MNLLKQPLILSQNYMKMRIGSEYRKKIFEDTFNNPVLLGTFDIVSLISNTSKKYNFRRFNNYTIVFISEIVIQNLRNLKYAYGHSL